MATNYEVRYYNWSRVLEDGPRYENRIFGSLKDAKGFAEQKLEEFLASVDPEVEFLGDSGWNSDTWSIEGHFYDEDKTPVETYIYVEQVWVDEEFEL